MKKIFLGFFLLGILEFHALFGADFEIKNLEVDLYSKTSSEMKKISMDLHIFTSEVAKSSAIKDAINVIVSSFYAQDLMSSKGKEAFKEAIKKYSASKYKIKIDDVYILSLKEIDNIDITRLVKQLDKYYKNSANKENKNIYTVEIRNRLQIGDSMELLIPNELEPKKFVIEEMWDIETKEPITHINPGKEGQKVILKIPTDVKEGWILRRKK